MDKAPSIINGLFLVIAVGIVAFNWLHFARISRANKEIRLYVPNYIKRCIDISTWVAICSALLVLLTIIFNLI